MCQSRVCHWLQLFKTHGLEAGTCAVDGSDNSLELRGPTAYKLTDLFYDDTKWQFWHFYDNACLMRDTGIRLVWYLLYLCVQLKVWTIIHTRSYPENRINGRPQIYYACTWWLTIQITKHTQCHCHKRKQPLRGTVCMDVSGIHIFPYSAIVATTLEMGCASTLQETIQWNQYLMLTKLKLSIHELLGDLQNTSPGGTSQMLVTCFLHCITLQTGCSQPTAYILLL